MEKKSKKINIKSRVEDIEKKIIELQYPFAYKIGDEVNAGSIFMEHGIIIGLERNNYGEPLYKVLFKDRTIGHYIAMYLCKRKSWAKFW